jgi:hypothetical protein
LTYNAVAAWLERKKDWRCHAVAKGVRVSYETSRLCAILDRHRPAYRQ